MIRPLCVYKCFSERGACGFLLIPNSVSDLRSWKGSLHPLLVGLPLLSERCCVEPFTRLSSAFEHDLSLFSQQPSGLSVTMIPVL